MTKLAKFSITLAIVGLGLWARLAPWEQVFGGPHPQLIGDSDPRYHVLRAERWLAGAPGAPWQDPALNWPHGADIPWPPLFDALLAGTARLLAGPTVDRDTLVAVAALMSVAFGIGFVLLMVALGRRILGAGGGWIGGLVVAFTAAGVDPSRVGRADQHVLETFLFCALLLAFLARPRPGRRAAIPPAWLAALVALAFWGWMGSAFHLLLLLIISATDHLLLPNGARPSGPSPGTRTLFVGAAGGAALLAATVAAWGRTGALASATTTGVGGLQVAMTAATGAFAGLLLLAQRRRPDSGGGARVLEVGVAALLPGLALLLVPSIRAGISGGLTALTAGNPWYATISEFQPLLSRENESGLLKLVMILRGYGLTLFVAPFALPGFLRAWRERETDRLGLLALAVLFLTLVPAAFLRKRFGVYAIIPLALATDLAVRDAARRIAARFGGRSGSRLGHGLAAAAALLVVLPSFPEHGLPDPTLPRDRAELLRWISDQPGTPGRECVFSPWSFGHSIQYSAGRPVVTSPFGTEGGADVMPAAAGFWFTTEGTAAERWLERRRCGLVLLGLVPAETWTLHGFAPPGTPSPFEILARRSHAGDLAETLAYWRLVPVRLYHEDGVPTRGGPALDGFRLLLETPATSPGNAALEEQWKLFEPVAGARLTVAAHPGSEVQASVELQTNTGRRLAWSTAAVAAANGKAILRLPYASGGNGLTHAGPWTIRVGDQDALVVVHEAAVREGRAMEISGPAGSR